MITPVKKFWLHDPPREVWCRRLRKQVVAKGHPRVLVAWRLLEKTGVIEYVTATWNPTDNLPFDRQFAHDRVDGLMRGGFYRQVRLPSSCTGARWAILVDILAQDRAAYRHDTARSAAAEHELMKDALLEQIQDAAEPIPPTDRNAGDGP